MKDLFAKNLSLCEECINRLMSDQGNDQISNTEQLLDKMLNFQDQLSTASSLVATVTVQQDPNQFSTMQPESNQASMAAAESIEAPAEDSQEPKKKIKKLNMKPKQKTKPAEAVPESIPE
jgi:hypothetical protein